MAREPELMDLTTVSSTFPGEPSNEIPRPYLLDLFSNVLDTSPTGTVLVKGPPGSGKTTFISQFARQNADRVFSRFLRSGTTTTYHPDLMKDDFSVQLYWALNNKLPDNIDLISEGYFFRAISNLSLKAQREGKFYYFVLDGFDELSTSEIDRVGKFISLLPFHNRFFRFVFSDSADDRLKLNKFNVTPQPFYLPNFSQEETEKYLASAPYFNQLNADEKREIYHIAERGNPGRLAPILRLLKDGAKLDDIANTKGDPLSVLYEMEWKGLNLTEDLKRILALLVFDHTNEYDDTTIAAVLGISLDEVRNALNRVRFLDRESSTVRFTSEAFRAFAESRLKDLKGATLDLLISRLEKNQQTELNHESNFSRLAKLYESSNRQDRLLEHLSTKNMIEIAKQVRSLSSVQEMVDSGISAAFHLKHDHELLRLSLHRPTIENWTGLESIRYEVGARIAIGEIESALSLVNSIQFQEDRLLLLALVARKLQGREDYPTGLRDEIIQLYQQLDDRSVVKRGLEIATELVHTNPALATDLIERLSMQTGVDIETFDLSVAMMASTYSGEENTEWKDALHRISRTIHDPAIREFSTHASLLSGNTTAEEVIAQVETLGSPERKLFWLKRWISVDPKRAGVADVVGHALNLLINATEYAPTATILRQLATPLPYIQDLEVRKRLINIFNSQAAFVESRGPTEDYVRLQLLLVRSEKDISVELARNRLVDVYFYIEDLKDLTIKANCLARFVSALRAMDPDMVFEKRDKFHSWPLEELQQILTQLFEETAYHDRVARTPLRALAPRFPDMTLEIIDKANTATHKDDMIKTAIEAHMESRVIDHDLDFINRALSKIYHPVHWERALAAVIENLSPDHATHPLIMTWLKAVKNPTLRCWAIAKIIMIAEGETYVDQLMTFLQSSWIEIESPWTRVNVGYLIAQDLAEAGLKDQARHYVARAEELQGHSRLHDPIVGSAFVECVELALRAFSGLLKSSTQPTEAANKIFDLIGAVPDPEESTALLTNMALRCHVAGKVELANEAVRKIRNNLTVLNRHNRTYDRCVIVSAPALYLNHLRTATEIIEQLPPPLADAAWMEVHRFLVHRRPFGDPIGTVQNARTVRGLEWYVALTDITDVISRLSQDAYIYLAISEAAEFFRLFDLTSQQKAEVTDRLVEIAKNRLPDTTGKFIRHQGYRIAAEAKALRLSGASKRYRDNWLALINEARQIRNRSDRALVLGWLAQSLPFDPDLRRSLFGEAREGVANIPFALEVVDRYEALATSALDYDKHLSKSFVRECVELLKQGAGSEYRTAYTTLVDTAYQIDPDLAESIASELDDDPARKRYKARLDLLRLKDALMDSRKKDQSDVQSASAEDYAQVFSMLLRALNSGRITPMKWDHLRKYVQQAGTTEFFQAISVFHWAIENIVQVYSDTPMQVEKYIDPTFAAIVDSCEVLLIMASRSWTQSVTSRHSLEVASGYHGMVVRAGEKGEAMEFIENWLKRNLKTNAIICDPFFGPNELEIVWYMFSLCPDCRIRILTGWKHQLDTIGQDGWEDAYRSWWRQRTDLDPPEIGITVAGFERSKQSPIHDRYIITDGGILKLGTSLNSIGIVRASQVDELDHSGVSDVESLVAEYLSGSRLRDANDRIKYHTFSL